MEASTHETQDRPRIYVASLADYNSGTLHGRWIFADDTADEIQRQVADMLSASGEEIAEEWAIHDYEGFGSLRLTEYEDLAKVADLGALIGEHGVMFAELAAHFGGLSGLEEARRYMEDGYCGDFDTLEDYARELIEECYGSEIQKLPDIVRYHIDYDGIAHDLEIGGDVFTIEHGSRVHVFYGNV